jgi:hypothetical protein
MDGGGCDFWKWEEEYEQWLVDNKHVPPSYQPVFQSTKMPQPDRRPEQFKDLTIVAREIVVLLKCLLFVCVLIASINLYGIVKSG